MKDQEVETDCKSTGGHIVKARVIWNVANISRHQFIVKVNRENMPSAQH